MLNNFLDRYLWNWDQIHGLGRLGVFKSAFVFLAFLPAAVQITSSIQRNFGFDVEPPFSWYLLFFSAFAVSCGNLFYYSKCPALVKNFPDFEKYSNSGRDRKYLLALIKQLWSDCPIEAASEIDSTDFDNWMAGLNIGNDIEPRVNHHEAVDSQPWMELGQDNKAEVTPKTFYFFRDLANIERRSVRVLCSGFYLAGLVLFAIVFLQNVWFVSKSLWPIA